MKLTKWYSGDVKPVRKGFYERKCIASGWPGKYSFWDGEKWLSGTNHLSIPYKKIASCHQQLPWRGVAKDQS